MTAKEMFEKLGYIENNDSELTQRYTKKGLLEELIEIRFYFKDKSIILHYPFS